MESPPRRARFAREDGKNAQGGVLPYVLLSTENTPLRSSVRERTNLRFCSAAIAEIRNNEAEQLGTACTYAELATAVGLLQQT
jgi:hypothetical protein